jgi:RHS repeat-associated protein
MRSIRSRSHPRCLVGLARVLAFIVAGVGVGVTAQAVHAQQSVGGQNLVHTPPVHPDVCTPGDNCPTYPPSVSITPAGGTQTASTVGVTVKACDQVLIASTTITLNGQDITGQFTPTRTTGTGTCTITITYVGTLTLNTGANVVTATVLGGGISGNPNLEAQQTVTFTQVVPGVSVIAATTAATAPSSSSVSVSFTVKNLSAAADSFALHAECTGAGVTTTCSSTPSGTVALAGNASTTVTVNGTTTATAGSLGTLHLVAIRTKAPAVADSAITDITVTAAPAAGLTLAGVMSWPAVEQDRCVAQSLGRRAAAVCGDLRLVHPLPAVKTFTKARTPVLVYNQRTARPFQIISALLTFPVSTTLPDSVTADVLVRVTGTSAYSDTPTSAKWAGSDWTSGSTRRIAADFDMGLDTTGLYDIVLVTHRWYTSTLHSVQHDSTHGQVVNVNRAASPFGAGWWLAGLEQIFGYSTNQLAWVGGDGSTRVYALASTNLWRPAVYTGERDSITYNPSTTTYTRWVPHGVQVLYTQSGRHSSTIDRLGHTTAFFYAPGGVQTYSVDSIRVPTSNGSLAYQFTYGTNGVVQSVSAPSPTGSGGTRRLVSLVTQATGYERAGYRIDSIADPDGSEVRFGYGLSCCGMLPDTLIDKRHGRTLITYDVTGAFAAATTVLGGGQASIVRTIRNPAVVGFSGSWVTGTHAAIPDSAYLLMIDPRNDTTRVWLDGYGEPRRLRDALGEETDLTRTNPTYPTVVTRERYANQRVVVATYDARGNLAGETDSSHVVSGVAATTTYTYDPRWDFPTRTVNPAGDGTVLQYDTLYGNPLWEEPLGDSTRRVTFSYWSGLNLLAHAVQPVEAPAQTTYYYDGHLGDMNTVITPLGYTTTMTLDSIGRVLTTNSPIDGTAVQTATSVYDLMDRVMTATSAGPALTHNMKNNWGPAYGPYTAAAKTVTVATTYTTEGEPASVTRTVSPDIDSLVSMETQWVYDSAGRRVKEIAPDLMVDSTVYDAAGNRVQWITRRRNTVTGQHDVITMQYDGLNRLAQRILPAEQYPRDTAAAFVDRGWNFPWYPTCSDGTSYCITTDTSTFAFDRVGNMTVANNSDARITRSYNPDGTLATDTLRVRTVTGSNFSTHVYSLGYQYDLDDRRITFTHPTTVAPIEGGNIVNTQQYSYDSDGEMNNETDVLGNFFDHRYDLDGRLFRVASEAATTYWTFDADGRVIQHADSTPDLNHGIDGWSFPTLHNFQNSYDQRDKLTSASSALPNDTVHVYNAYDGMGALVDGLVRTPSVVSPSAFSQEVYVPDGLGNVRAHWTASLDLANNSSSDSASSIFTQFYTPHTARYGLGLTNQSATALLYALQYKFDSAGNQIGSYVTRQVNSNPDVVYIGTNEYYDAANRLRELDKRECVLLQNQGSCSYGNGVGSTVSDFPYIEEYRYDALGRRVWKRARANPECSALGNNQCFSTIERFVYDGDQVLYEIRMPGGDTISAVALERDTGAVASYENAQRQYGRVIYTNGTTMDEPLDVVRVGYDTLFPGPVQFVPLQDWRGGYDLGTLPLGAQYKCSTFPDSAAFANNRNNCFVVDYSDPRYGFYWQDTYLAGLAVLRWNGDLLTGNRDATNRLYRRNRFFDPQSGRFTQEDPIGLAGGLNAYGFGAGDPVNYSDPFGLCIEDGCVAEGAIVVAAAEVVAPGLTHLVGAAITSELATLSLRAAALVADAGTTVIGKIGAIHLKVGETVLQLPDQGGIQANWKQNSSKLREAIREKGAIRDAHVNPDGTLASDRKPNGSASFLTAERDLLRNQGYIYNPKTQRWTPPQ